MILNSALYARRRIANIAPGLSIAAAIFGLIWR